MSDYTPITDWGYKDGLTTGNPDKRIRGSEFDTEFAAIQSASATKHDSDWSSANLGLVDTLQGLTTAATEDVLWGWDFGAVEPLAYFTMGNGLAFNGTTIEVTDSEVDHDVLTNWDADAHILHAGVEVQAGQGLTGGGDISATRVINVGEGNGITVSGNSIAAEAGNGISVTASGIAAVARPSRGLAVSASGISLAIDNTDTITNVDIDYSADYFVMFDDSGSSPAKVLMSDVVASLDAEDISYDNSITGLTADTVQEAIDEVLGDTVQEAYELLWVGCGGLASVNENNTYWTGIAHTDTITTSGLATYINNSADGIIITATKRCLVNTTYQNWNAQAVYFGIAINGDMSTSPELQAAGVTRVMLLSGGASCSTTAILEIGDELWYPNSDGSGAGTESVLSLTLMELPA